MILDQLSALAHPQRLALFRLLMRRYPDAVPAGELGEALAVRQNTLSAYLSTLRQAGLIDQTRQGRSLLYSARTAEAGALVSYLVEDCCRGRADRCADLSVRAPAPAGGYNVLFLCTGNSARSLMAEAILREEAGDRFTAFSAGTRPREQAHPMALDLLRKGGHDVSALHPKDAAIFREVDAPRMDFVISVCDRAANEDCPAWPGHPVAAHWGMPDSVLAQGTEAERHLAFREVHEGLRRRIFAFAALPLDTLDRLSRQHHLDTLAKEPVPA